MKYKNLQISNAKRKIIILSSIILFICLLFILKGRITHEKFDSFRWKNWKESEAEWSLRWDMMNSLRHQYKLSDMTIPEIKKLLGEPDTRYDNVFTYYLGMARSGIDIGTLTIEFDQKGRVKKYIVTRS